MTNALFQQKCPGMRLPWRSFGLAIALFLNLPAIEAAQPVCSANTTPVVTRMEGKTEPVADIVLTCSGGTPTLANQPVPQVDINVFLNTTITSHITANSEFNEALLLVDEPNTLPPPQHPLLNCGQLG